MDIDRAKQIMNSPETIQVLFQGKSVWIDAIHADHNAEILFLDTRKRSQVPIINLEEA